MRPLTVPVCVCFLAGVCLLPICLGGPPAQPSPGQPPARTGQQRQQQLRERDRLAAEAKRQEAAGKLAEAIATAEKVLALERHLFGNVHSEVAGSLEFLADLHESRGEFAAAQSLRKEVLQIATKLYGQKDWRVTNARIALTDSGRFLHWTPAEQRQLAEAEKLFQQFLSLKAKGKYREALPPTRTCADIHKRLFGEHHRLYAACLNNIAELHRQLGDYTKAEALYRQGLEISNRALGTLHPDNATVLNNLALVYQNKGELAKAEALLRQARDILAGTLGVHHHQYGLTLNNLAELYLAEGNYAQAEPIYRESMAVTKAALGEKDLQYSFCLHNLAGLYWAMGDTDRAEPLYRQAQEILRQAVGEQHPYYAQVLNNLALVYLVGGEYARAEPLFRQALEIKKHTLGKKHPDYAQALHNLAGLYWRTRQYTKAEPLFREALELRKEVLGEQHPRYATTLDNLARMYQEQGKYTRAKPLLHQAAEIRKQALGKSHPYYAESLLNLAKFYRDTGDVATAGDLCRQALQINRSNLELAAVVQSERQQLAMARAVRYSLDTYVGLPSQPTASPAYAAVLAWKGAITARQRRVRLERRPELAGAYAQFTDVTRRLAHLAFTVPPARQQEAWKRQVQELTDQKEQLEAALAGKSASFRRAQQQASITPALVQRVLPEDAALVDVLEYVQTGPVAKGTAPPSSESRLAAFVVRRDSITRVDLGPARLMAGAIDRWLRTLRRRQPTQDPDDSAVELRRRLWRPLEPYLQRVHTVLISPDGALCRLPAGALPGSRPDTYLLEDLAVAVVPVPQLLPELLARPMDRALGEPSLLLVGDVDYGGDPGVADARGGSRSAPRSTRGGALRWKQLEATREEIVAIHDSFHRRYRTAAVTELREDQATEASVRQAAAHHRFLHLATHGFFAASELHSALAPRAGESDRLRQSTQDGFDPGLLSGLVLAGANRPIKPEKDDGILTALEVSALDLSGVELATLSACQTGLGEAAGGEGLLGLQRAFQVAGARSVVASLWKVDDDATRQLMVRFYENLWKRHLPKVEALRQAQLWMLREGRPRGLDAGPAPRQSSRRLPPYYWAAFVLSGDWR